MSLSCQCHELDVIIERVLHCLYLLTFRESLVRDGTFRESLVRDNSERCSRTNSTTIGFSRRLAAPIGEFRGLKYFIIGISQKLDFEIFITLALPEI